MEPFGLEEYFAKHEFTAKFLLSSSDAESVSMKYLLSLADEECSGLWENLWLGYTETQGRPVLRQAIAEAFYSGLSSENILCCAGAEEGIYCFFKGLLTKDDHCIVVTPCYQSLRTIPASICDVTAVDLIPEGWRIDIAAIAAAVRPNTRAIVINFPHNPTGTTITAEEQQALISLARSHDLWIFSDEVYRGLELEEHLRLPCIASIYERGVSLGVVSKSLGLAGLRIGWLACQNASLLHSFAGYKHYLSICNSAPSEVLALIAIRNRQSLLERNRSLIVSNRALIETFLAKHSDLFEWSAPKGGCCGFVRFKSTRLSLSEFADLAVNQFGVLLLPGEYFPTDSLNVHSYFRFGFGRVNFPVSLGELEKAIHVLHPPTLPAPSDIDAGI